MSETESDELVEHDDRKTEMAYDKGHVPWYIVIVSPGEQ